MAQYYYSDEGGGSQKSSSLTLRIVDLVAMLLTLVAFVALVMTLITSYYDPSVSWLFVVLGLVTPAVYLFALILALYWVIRWRWIYASLLLLPLVVGAPAVSRYYNIETSKSYGDLPRRGVMRLMSFNVRNLIDSDGQSSTEKMIQFLDEARVDVVALQEMHRYRFKGDEESRLLEGYDEAHIGGMAIYSKYKIIESSDNLIQSDSGSGKAFWVDMIVGSDTLRLYNIHLHSTAITANDDAYLSKMEFLSDSLSEDKLKGIVSRFRRSSIGRAAQADTIALSIEQSPYSVVVCGDFNDTPNSYSYRKISHGLSDAFQEVGVGYSYTYRGFLNLLRIDYVLMEEPLMPLSYEVVDSLTLSDHLPIITTLKL
ncbi:MAG: endonuclease/exonuclease/phosphatase family protein [Rikenellaceae bacterium]